MKLQKHKVILFLIFDIKGGGQYAYVGKYIQLITKNEKKKK